MLEKRGVGWLLGFAILIVFFILFYSISQVYDFSLIQTLTGRQIDVERPTIPSQDVGGEDETPSGSGSSGGLPTGTKKVSVDSPVVFFEEVAGFSVEIVDQESITENSPVLVEKPSYTEEVVANGLASVKSTISVPKKIENGQIKANFPDGARYVRVVGPEGSEVSVGTGSFFGDFAAFSVGNTKRETVTIQNPDKGSYELIFSASTPYVSSVESRRVGETNVEVKNPTGLDYVDVNVYAEIDSEKGTDFKVLSGDGRVYVSSSYDSNGDGIPDVVKFVTDIPKNSEKTFTILKVPGEGKEVGVLTEGVFLSPTIPTSLPRECEEALKEVRSSSCELAIQGGSVIRGEVSGNLKKTYYGFENVDCPTSFVKAEFCLPEGTKNVEVVPVEVSESPDSSSTGSSVRTTVKSVELIESGTTSAIALLTYDYQKSKLDIVFK